MWKSVKIVIVAECSGMCVLGGNLSFEAGGKFSFCSNEVILVIIKVKYRIMTLHIQYKIQVEYGF